jgi:hypothetical protein
MLKTAFYNPMDYTGVTRTGGGTSLSTSGFGMCYPGTLHTLLPLKQFGVDTKKKTLRKI